MDKDIYKFLLTRNVSEKDIVRMQQDKIDAETILGIADDVLAKYVPRLGDRVALRNQCQVKSNSDEKCTKRTKLFEILRQKMNKLDGKHSSDHETVDSVCKKMKKKSTRRIEFGFIHNKRQVRKRQGGGTRKLDVDRECVKANLLEIGTNLFFPNGISSKGALEKFTLDILDFKETSLPDDISVADCYHIFKTGIVTFYLHAVETEKSNGAKCSNSNSKLIPLVQQCPAPTTSMGCTDIIANASQVAGLDDTVGTEKSTDAKCSNSKLIPLIQQSAVTPTTSKGCSDTVAQACPVTGLYDDMESEESNKVNCCNSKLISLIQQSPVPSTSTGCTDTLAQACQAVGLYDEELMLSDITEEEIKLNLGTIYNGENCLDALDDTVPFETDQTDMRGPIINIRLHRGHVFNEMNDAIRDRVIDSTSNIQVQMVLPNGRMEQGEDSGGVLRDAFSEYFDTFYKKCTIGNTIRIPVTRHDMRDKWHFVGKVIALAYNTTGYFPVCIAQPFLAHCMGNNIQEESLLETFLQIIPNGERTVLEKAIHDFHSMAEDDELFDILEAHEVKSLLTSENIQQILSDVAHKELIQDPSYIAECWGEHLKQLKLPPGGIKEVACSLTPTANKVISTLRFEPDMSSKERAMSINLKRFIRGCTEQKLKEFLRFCTGADISVCQDINVRFVEAPSDFARNPIAHTCGCVLEIPNTYTSYLEFTQEFTELLDHKLWVMDIV